MGAMRVLPNEPASWDSKWRKDKVSESLRRGSVWDVLDEVKFSYLRPIIPVEGGSALEVGCGSARLLAMLARLGWKTTGIDFTSSALELARERFKADALRAVWIRGDCHKLPFPDGAYDLVASTGLLEHFADPEPILSEMLRVLRPGGVFYSDIVPRKFSLLRALDGIGDSAGGDEIFERCFSRREIERFMSGFRALRDVRVSPAGIFLPRKLFSKRIAFLHRNEYGINRRVAALCKRLDGSWLADWLGFYYFVSAMKI